MLNLVYGVMPMRTWLEALVMLGALTVPAAAMPAVEGDSEWTEWEEEGPPAAAADDRGPRETVTPPSGPPAEPAPAPPARTPPPPRQEAQAEATTGQWVYTQQYGWVWMPYADRYLYLPPDGPPYAYLYYPAYGWTWVAAPWIFGWGPWPYFGFHGAFYYGWYGHGWWRQPWRWYAGPPRGWNGPYYNNYRPAPGRPGARPAPGGASGYGTRGAGPAVRGAPGPAVRGPGPAVRGAPGSGARAAPSAGARGGPGRR